MVLVADKVHIEGEHNEISQMATFHTIVSV